MKKVISLVLMVIFLSTQSMCFASDMLLNGVVSKVTKIQSNSYSKNSDVKGYVPYEITLINKNTRPILLSSNSTVEFNLKSNGNVLSDSRREIYKNSRRKDIGWFYPLGLIGWVSGAGITICSCGLGTGLGAMLMAFFYSPTDTAVRNNVALSQEVYSKYEMPIRIEPNMRYTFRVYAQNSFEVKEINITKVSFDMKTMYTLKIPVKTKVESL